MDLPNDGEAGRLTQGPMRIVTDWRRLACGLWRLPKGDIAAAYCANIFPKLKAFSHEGRLYMNGGTLFSGPVRSFANCYPLIPPDEYTGPESVPYSYEGKEGQLKGKVFRLGPKVIFESTHPTIDEWTRMFRVLYADGGHFAHGVTYLEFLKERHSPKAANESIAHSAELDLCQTQQMPRTQTEMKHFLEEIVSVFTPDIQHQLELSL